MKSLSRLYQVRKKPRGRMCQWATTAGTGTMLEKFVHRRMFCQGVYGVSTMLCEVLIMELVCRKHVPWSASLDRELRVESPEPRPEPRIKSPKPRAKPRQPTIMAHEMDAARFRKQLSSIVSGIFVSNWYCFYSTTYSPDPLPPTIPSQHQNRVTVAP